MIYNLRELRQEDEEIEKTNLAAIRTILINHVNLDVLRVNFCVTQKLLF